MHSSYVSDLYIFILFFYMVSQSFMTLDDLLDSSINWIPSKLNLDNYKQAAQSMDFWKSFGQSIIIAGVPTLCNLLSCSVIGYGLARFEFPGKESCTWNYPLYIYSSKSDYNDTYICTLF